MKVSFDATLEDFIDVSVRSAPRTTEWYIYLVLSIIDAVVIYGVVAQFFWANPFITGIGAVGGLRPVADVRQRPRGLLRFRRVRTAECDGEYL